MTDTTLEWPCGKVGYCAFLGRPNAGKSTLLNQLLDYHLTAVSSKPQTTRRRWLGIHSDEDSQILFLDTPGIHAPKHALGEFMVDSIQRAINDADLVICLADTTRSHGEEDSLAAAAAKESHKPVYLVLNKIDAASPEQIEETRAFFQAELGDCTVFELSALKGDGSKGLLTAMKDAMPSGPFLFPPDQITDAFEREIAREIIRETVLETLHKEIPHSVGITIETWKEQSNIRKISGTLHLERDNQKYIVIGGSGTMIKKIMVTAAEAISETTGLKTRLKLYVKVSKDWRKKRSLLGELA